MNHDNCPSATTIGGFVRSDVTGRQFPILVRDRNELVPAIGYGIPAKHQFHLGANFIDTGGFTPTQFLRDFGRLTFSFEYDGKTYKRYFTHDEIASEIQRAEEFLRPQISPSEAGVRRLHDQHPNTHFDALVFQYEDKAPFVSTEPLGDGRIKRSISVAIVNSGNGYISNVSARIKSITPETGSHMPLNLDSGIFDLKAPGQNRILQLFTYPASSDSAIRMALPFTGTLDYHPFIQKGSYVVGIEASGDQTKSVETYFRLWVDETDQLRIAMV